MYRGIDYYANTRKPKREDKKRKNASQSKNTGKSESCNNFCFFEGGILSPYKKVEFSYSPKKESRKRRFYSIYQCLLYCRSKYFRDDDTAGTILEFKDNLKGILNYLEVNKISYNYEEWFNVAPKYLESIITSLVRSSESYRVGLMAMPRKELVFCGKDRLLGIGVSFSDSLKINPYYWRGSNIYGVLLTKVRNMLNEGYE